jgi:hypothetical protein
LFYGIAFTLQKRLSLPGTSYVKIFYSVLMALFVLGTPAFSSYWGYDGKRSALDGYWWEESLDGFGNEDYAMAVERLLGAFESAAGRLLEPGEYRRAALKVYTQSGKGLATPKALVLALIGELERRGFRREDLLIVDTRKDLLREAGFLPPLSAIGADSTFAGVPVVALEDDAQWHPDWSYENPLPPEFSTALGRELLGTPIRQAEMADKDRLSYLPYPLLFEVDFFINLPVVTDHRVLGLNGVLANATVWAVSNRDRFLHSPASGPVAVAEIAAIPELLSNWAISIVSLEKYQYIGGPSFRSLYTASEPQLLLSTDPVVLDSLMQERIDKARQREGFRPLKEILPMLEYSQSLGVGRPHQPFRHSWQKNRSATP